MHRLHVDWTRCDGHGSCAELLPELFEQDEWGYPLARTSLEVPARLEEHAWRAVDVCPLPASTPAVASRRATRP